MFDEALGYLAQDILGDPDPQIADQFSLSFYPSGLGPKLGPRVGKVAKNLPLRIVSVELDRLEAKLLMSFGLGVEEMKVEPAVTLDFLGLQPERPH